MSEANSVERPVGQPMSDKNDRHVCGQHVMRRSLALSKVFGASVPEVGMSCR